MNLQGKKLINYITNFLILTAVFLSMLNTNSINAQTNSIIEEESSALKILQGEFIHESIGINEVLSFTLDVKDPHEGNAFYWKVLVAPKFGDAQVSSMGKSAEVSYKPTNNPNGEDFFIVQVNDDRGASAQIHISVTIVPDDSISGLKNPEYFETHTPNSPGKDGPEPDARTQPQNPHKLEAPEEELIDNNLESRLARLDEIRSLSDIANNREGPYLEASLNYNEIYTSGWAVDANLTLSIDDPDNGAGVDYSDSGSGSSYYFYIYNYRLEAGDIVTVSDGSTTKIHTVINLAVTDFNETSDILSGTSDPGDLEVYACNIGTCDWRYPTASIEGMWETDFSGSVDISSTADGYIYQYDSDGDSTSTYWFVPDPYMIVYPAGDYIYSYDWKPNIPVTLTIDGIEISTSESTYWGYADFRIEPFDITTGQEIVMSDGTYTITHLVTSLTITGFDEIADTVSGTAESGSKISVSASGQMLEVTADTSDFWVANFSGLVDITSGTGGYARQYDAEGNATHVSWYIPDPYMVVYPEGDYIYSYDWAPYTSVLLTIDGNEITTQQSSDWGDADFWLEPFDITAGQEIVMSDGTYTITHIVTPLAVTDFDEDADIVSGTAESGSTISVSASGQMLEVTADTLNSWVANFSGLVDITSGTSGYARQYDSEGNSTNIRWYVPDPYMRVYPLDDYVYGERWTPNTTIMLTIGDSEWTKVSSEDGWVNFDLHPFNLLPGQELVMTDGTYTRTHFVTSLTVTGFDEDLDTVSGTAEAGTQVYLDAWDDYDWEDLSVTTDSSGKWTAYFSYLDITSGAGGYALQYDDQGNSTNIYWFIPDPYLRVYPMDDRVTGDRWTIDTMITLSIGEAQWTSESDEGGWVSFNIEPFDILSGHEIVMTDGIYTRTHVVRDLAITGVDEENNIVTGTAAPESPVSVTANDDYNWESKEVIADTTGLWTADFSGMIDFASGTNGYARQYDDEDNSTNVRWFIPDPRFQVYLINDYIYGSQWTPNSTVTASIDGVVKGSGMFDENGWGYIDITDEFVPGQVVSLTDGTYTRTHTVLDLAVTNVDPITDIVTGTADPGSEITVQATDDDEWYNLYPITDINGVWHANFAGISDIEKGEYGWAVQADENENETVFRWLVPNPLIRVYPRYGEVYGSQWPSEAIVTLTIGSQTWTQEADEYNGSVYFYPEINLVPGLTIQMTDGVTTKTHIIIDLAVTDFDTVADTLSGTANPGELTVYTCVSTGCYYRYPVAATSGNWTADFSGLADIAPGSDGWMYQEDADGDETRMYWSLPNPRTEVHPNADTIYCYGWPPYTQLSLSIGGVPVETKESSSNGYVYFELKTHDLQPGQAVEITDGTYTKTHTIIDLAVTDYDETMETMMGTANPGELTVDAWGDGYEILYPEADINGDWNVQFTSMNLAPGAHAGIFQSDEDNDLTYIHWLIPDPAITAYLSDNFVVARDWPQNTDITLTIDSTRETWTEKSSESGYASFDLDPYIIQPGDSIEMTDGTTTQTHIVQNLVVTDIDNNSDILRGTGDPESELIVCAYDYTNNYYESECLTINTDTTGNWEANFAGLIDIRPGVEGSVRQYDENENFTYIYWSVSAGSPLITGQKELSTPEDTDLTISLTDLYVTDPDSIYPDDFSLLVMPGENYSLSGNLLTPAKDFYGSLTVPVKVNDGLYNSNTFDLSITVTPENDPPIVSNIPDQSINQGETFSTISLNDYVSDVDHTDAEITWSTSGEIDLEVSIDAENVATIVIPNVDWSGSEVITFTATDLESGSDSDTATFSVNAADNNPPDIAGDDPQVVTMSEDGNPTPFSLALNASDDDVEDTLTWGISSQATNGTATASGTSNSIAVGYTPDQDYNGSDSFVVQVLDGNGGTDTITINVTIEAVNDAPVITGQATSLSTEKETPLQITLADLIVVDVDNTYPSDFTLEVLSGFNYTPIDNVITPAENFTGILNVNVRVNDGESYSNIFELTVTVVEGNKIFLPLILR